MNTFDVDTQTALSVQIQDIERLIHETRRDSVLDGNVKRTKVELLQNDRAVLQKELQYQKQLADQLSHKAEIFRKFEDEIRDSRVRSIVNEARLIRQELHRKRDVIAGADVTEKYVEELSDRLKELHRDIGSHTNEIGKLQREHDKIVTKMQELHTTSSRKSDQHHNKFAELHTALDDVTARLREHYEIVVDLNEQMAHNEAQIHETATELESQNPSAQFVKGLDTEEEKQEALDSLGGQLTVPGPLPSRIRERVESRVRSRVLGSRLSDYELPAEIRGELAIHLAQDASRGEIKARESRRSAMVGSIRRDPLVQKPIATYTAMRESQRVRQIADALDVDDVRSLIDTITKLQEIGLTTGDKELRNTVLRMVERYTQILEGISGTSREMYMILDENFPKIVRLARDKENIAIVRRAVEQMRLGDSQSVRNVIDKLYRAVEQSSDDDVKIQLLNMVTDIIYENRDFIFDP